MVISRSGEIIIQDEHGRERERHKVPYGATLSVKVDQQIKAGTILANWDPLTRPIITEFAGQAKFENVEEGLTVAKRRWTKSPACPRWCDRPQAPWFGQGGQAPGQADRRQWQRGEDSWHRPLGDHRLQIGALIQVRDGMDVGPGEVLARIPIEGQKTRDITGGLPRVAELFEARTPKDKGTLAEATGTVSFGKETRARFACRSRIRKARSGKS